MSSANFHALEQAIVERWPAASWQDVGVVLAVSGGADSVAMLRAVQTLKTAGLGRLAVAHFNHHLRGEESDADQAFVAALCERLGLEFHAGQAETPLSLAGGDGLEAAARQARYEFLRRLAEQLGARYVATAHTADDQAETILLRVFRGTGLSGLAGIPERRALGPAVTLVRPLLHTTREEVASYLQAIDQPYREDASNLDRQFMRNRIRHELLPLLKRDYAPDVSQALVRLGSLAADAVRVIDRLTDALFDACVVERSTARVAIDCRRLAGQDRHLVRELFLAVWRRQGWPLQAMGYVQWSALAEMALAPAAGVDRLAPKQVLPGAVVAERRDELLIVTAPDEPAAAPYA
jgi:tRNA(Ile)-lysidine synthase